MKVGIISDSHDNLPLIRAALCAFADAGAEAIVHAGDIISPFAARELGYYNTGAGLPLYAVYGNNDGEKKELPAILEGIRPGPRKFTLGAKRFLLVHDRGAHWNLKHPRFRGFGQSPFS